MKIKRESAVCFFDQNGDGQKGFEDFLDGDRASAGTSTAMRGRKCFMQIEVHHVDPKSPGRVTPVRAFMFAPSM